MTTLGRDLLRRTTPGAGLAARVVYPNGFLLRRDCTPRGQLAITGEAWPGDNPYFKQRLSSYAYYADGKVYSQDAGSGLSDVRTAFTYDGRGQTSSVNTYRLSPVQRYSLRSYWRDARDRITAWEKSTAPAYNVMENGRGNRYAYDAKGELYSAWYQGEHASSTTPTNPQRAERFSYDELGNRQGDNAVAGRGWVTFLRRDNGLNQYVRWTPSLINYDTNGAETSEGGISMNFNALNQPIGLAAPPAVPSGSYLWFGYDPLGRCVKRWVSPTSMTTPNGVHFMYYEGWNLIQETTAGASAPHIYVHGGRVDEIVADYNYATDAQRHYHHYDAQGNCILLTNRLGNLIEQYDYDAFGNRMFITPSGRC